MMPLSLATTRILQAERGSGRGRQARAADFAAPEQEAREHEADAADRDEAEIPRELPAARMHVMDAEHEVIDDALDEVE
jgi:hypothetical protein